MGLLTADVKIQIICFYSHRLSESTGEYINGGGGVMGDKTGGSKNLAHTG